ncbi:sperm-associated antigen 16 protein [Kryptolebias marmoratus]|uniref:sperm-associated antigen 16 protein n=1 Tax=Kryptolebias marmoratus TaxID=37003 RepID=UPI0007F8F32D|nr:sperm-associated antigen 16 protein [Kryptolebias marmoratus]
MSTEEKTDFSEGQEQEEEVRKAASSEHQAVQNLPEPVEDFLRNFLHRWGLSRTLSSFEVEWYGSARRLRSDASFVPDALTHRDLLLRELDSVRRDTRLLREDGLRTAESLLRLQRERDFHRLQHRRVSQQKSSLMGDRRHLEEHLESCRSALRQLEEKHQAALRDKTLLDLQGQRSKRHRAEGQNGPQPPGTKVQTL